METEDSLKKTDMFGAKTNYCASKISANWTQKARYNLSAFQGFSRGRTRKENEWSTSTHRVLVRFIVRAGQHGFHFRTAVHEQDKSLLLYGYAAVILTIGCKSIRMSEEPECHGPVDDKPDAIFGSSTDTG